MTTAHSETRLLFITNLKHQDRDEDLYLANRLADEWTITLANTDDAARIAESNYTRAFIRNAWPSSEFDTAFSILEVLTKKTQLKTYNPPSDSRGFHEEKSYLVKLYEAGYPVIPSFHSADALYKTNKIWAERALYKPLNGCSGRGIITGMTPELPKTWWVYQPWLEFKYEVSIFFIDNKFIYALKSASHTQRWELSEFEPSSYDLAWAKQFINWNKLAYGIQRIDWGRTSDGRLWLTEVEDFLPYLSLLELSSERRDQITKQILSSVRWNLAS